MTDPNNNTIMKKIRMYASILLVASLGTACEEDEPLLPIPQLLDGRQWGLESRTIERPDGSVENVAIDYCDISNFGSLSLMYCL